LVDVLVFLVDVLVFFGRRFSISGGIDLIVFGRRFSIFGRRLISSPFRPGKQERENE
jgi:hypothetical protein